MNLPFVDLKAQYRLLKSDIDTRIQRVLESGAFILGPEVGELEAALGRLGGAPHVVACANGTDALQIALMVEKVGRGDAVFVPAFTYAATAEAVVLVGATPVFVESDAHTFNIDAADLERRIAATAKAGKLTPRAIIAVDLFGQAADYPALNAVAERHGLALIADAAQSYGGTLGGKPVGSLAPITTTSFYPSKPLGCYGDGGAMFFQDDAKAELARSIAFHGSSRTDRYDMALIGMNSRLDTIQAAVLLGKLTQFAQELAARERVAQIYDQRLGNVVATPARVPGATSAWAQYTIQVDDRDGVAKRLKDAGVPTAIYYQRPLHRQTAYAVYGDGAMPVSERLADRVLSLPMHGYMDDATAHLVCDAVTAAVAP